MTTVTPNKKVFCHCKFVVQIGRSTNHLYLTIHTPNLFGFFVINKDENIKLFKNMINLLKITIISYKK